MSTRYMRAWMPVVASLLGAMTAQADYINHRFDASPFTNGATFMTAVSNWQSSTPSVTVVNTKSYSPSHSILLPEGSAISNAVAQSGPSVVWTDMRIAPCLGVTPHTSAMNGVTCVSYFGTNGYLHVWNGSAWLACSNDVWNQPVSPATNGVFATLSIYQNFSNQRIAVLLNDQVVAQDVPFALTTNAYGSFFVQNVDSNAWLDDVYVQTSYDPARLTHDRNSDGLVDGNELQTHGYVARTLAVGGSSPYAYASLSNALAVARDRDTLYVTGAYAESVTVTQDVILAGSFTNSGTITVAAVSAVTVSNGFTSSLIVSGTVAFAQGVAVSGAVVTVAGTLNVPTNNAQLLAGTLNINGGGTVVSTGGRVADAGAGVDLTGGFTLTSGTWHAQAVAGLDFIEDFEQYVDNTRVQNLGFRGWGASDAGVIVKAAQGYGNSKGAILPESGLISNRLSTAGQTNIWTDFRLKPVLGFVPAAPATNEMAFLGYVAANGFLNVWAAGSWAACTNYVNGSNVTAMSTGAYARVTAFLNFNSRKAAVFVDGKLAREQVGFPAGAAVPSYSSFTAYNTDNNAYVDNVRITTSFPADLTDDLDGDDTADANEIQAYDSLLVWNGPRTLFKFR